MATAVSQASVELAVKAEFHNKSELQNKPQGKRPFDNGDGRGAKPKRFKKDKKKEVKEGSSEEVLLADIQSMLAAQKLSDEHVNGNEPIWAQAKKAEEQVPEKGSEVEVEVIELSSTGDGLAREPGKKEIFVIPFTVPGDVLKVKPWRHFEREQYWAADLISIIKPSPLRDDSRVTCKYFTKCSGCQFQMMDYAEQLKHKRKIVEKAFKNFSQLPPELIPQIQDTVGSPLQYGYRTKLTPHFDAPPGFRGRGKKRQPFETVPEIGFMQKGTRKTLDIEDCPIGTDAVRKGMKRERARMQEDFSKYERGATILLRESTKRIPKGEAVPEVPEDAVAVETDAHMDIKTCITDNNATSVEYIDDFIFTNPAGSFFQNNNSILPVFTDYVRQHIMPPAAAPADSISTSTTAQKPIKYLIDAYSGSGLFTITLSSLFSGGSVGIDIADKSIDFASKNAELNKLDPSQCRFIAADAPELFKSVKYDPEETVVVLDPPRKGCDASFLRQLLNFGPRRIVYVSCNVHTQARDVGVLVRGELDGGASRAEGKSNGFEAIAEKTVKKGGTRYEIETLRGFDFFPQTGHVEGVAVLNRVMGA